MMATTPQSSTPTTTATGSDPTPITGTSNDDPEPPSFNLPEEFPNPPLLSTLGHTMKYTPKGTMRRLATSFRLFKQLRGRLSKRTILTARIDGQLSDKPQRAMPFSGPPPLSLPALTYALRVAAHDPRIAHVHLRVDPLSCSWGKVFEVRRHLEYFRSSGKGVSIFLESGGPKEFFLGMGFALYVPPDGALGLRGFAASGSFVGGVLKKIGIEPQVERIGKYKSAGDQLARSDMSSAQREVINALLSDIHGVWTKSVCEATGIEEQTLRSLVDRSPWEMQEYLDAGLITGMTYETDLMDALKIRFTRNSSAEKEEDLLKKKFPGVEVQKYIRRTNEKLLAISGSKKIAVIRAVGAITSGKDGNSPIMGQSIGSESLVELIKKVRDDKQYVAVLLRCDSPGGSALASDIMWNELRKLGKKKPLIASQSDVAASGGYYLSMASEIVAEPLTITGSVGVVTAKPSLGELYKKVGYSKENISVGSKYAQILVDDRPFTDEEAEYFREGAEIAYRKFVTKAAQSRGKSYEEMNEVAQGRVWTGLQAKERGLVDHIGGMHKAIELLKEKAGISADEYVKLEEIKAPSSLAERLGLKLAIGAKGNFTMQKDIMQPLAMTEIDASLGEVSPVTKFIMEAALTPIMNTFPFLGNNSGRIDTMLEKILRSL